jgi:hypothetical protein
MQRRFVDYPQAPAASRRLVQFLRLDRQAHPKRLRSDRTRGAARLQHYLRIARGQTA